jgi:serine/threonine-protein kinase
MSRSTRLQDSDADTSPAPVSPTAVAAAPVSLGGSLPSGPAQALDVSGPVSPQASPWTPVVPGHSLRDREPHSLDDEDDATDEHNVAPSEGAQALPPNERPFGRYTLLRRLAFGGMGEVFLAKQGGQGSMANVAKLVVVKRILSHMRRDEQQRRMFLDEARLQALLNNRHIVQIYDVGEHDEHVYIAMEHAHGPSWRALIERLRERKKALHPATAIDLVVQACRGLAYAHHLVDASGAPLRMVHRDINPHNLIVTYDGEVKIIDFGIAKSEMGSGNTETGTIKGKFAYMSPEQSAAEPLDQRSDLFTLAICLYELLSLNNPFKKVNIVLSLEAIQKELTPPIDRVRPDCGPLVPILERALAKDPDDRFADCTELGDALQALLDDGLVEKAPQSLPALLRELFAPEIAEHLHVLEQTGSASGFALNNITAGSQPNLKRPPGSSTSGARKAQSTTSRVPAPLPELTVATPAPFSDAEEMHELSFEEAALLDEPVVMGQSLEGRALSELVDDAHGPGDTHETAVVGTLLHDGPPTDDVAVAPTTMPSSTGTGMWLPVAAVGVATFVVVGIVALWWVTREAAPVVHEPVVVERPVVATPVVVPTIVPPAPVPSAPVSDTPATVPPAAVVDTHAPAAVPVPVAVVARDAEKDPAPKPQKPAVDVKVAVEAKAVPEPKTAPEPKPIVDKGPVAFPREFVGTLNVTTEGFAVKGNRRLFRDESTTLTVGGPDAPLQVKLTVKVVDGVAQVAIASEPWAIVRVDAVGRGKTPLANVAVPVGKRVNLTLQNPKMPAMELGLTLQP